MADTTCLPSQWQQQVQPRRRRHKRARPLARARPCALWPLRRRRRRRQALGSKGLAVSVTPPESTLEPWGRLVLIVSCFNDMCGAYMDMLHVKVSCAA